MKQINPDYISKISQSPNSSSDAFRTHVQVDGMDWFPKSNGLILPNGFKVVDNKPLDARSHVLCLEDLRIWRPTLQGFPYVGMSVLVIFKHRFGFDENKPLDHAGTDWAKTGTVDNLLLQRYVCVSIMGKKDGSSTVQELTVANNGGSDQDIMWTFEPDCWVPERSEASGFADGVFVVVPPKDKVDYILWEQKDANGSITYWKAQPDGSNAKLILWSNGAPTTATINTQKATWGNAVETAAGTADNPGANWKAITWTSINQSTGATTTNTPATAEQAFQYLVHHYSQPQVISSNADNLAENIIKFNNESTDVNGNPVTKTSYVNITNHLTVKNVVTQKTENTSYAGGYNGVADNDNNKYVRISDAIGVNTTSKQDSGANTVVGQDYRRPVTTIANIGGKDINMGITLEWAEWEE